MLLLLLVLVVLVLVLVVLVLLWLLRSSFAPRRCIPWCSQGLHWSHRAVRIVSYYLGVVRRSLWPAPSVRP